MSQFWFAVFIQNLFLSAPYGRNWEYLFASKHISEGAASSTYPLIWHSLMLTSC